MLLPTPNVREWEEITVALREHKIPAFESVEDFLNKPLDILATYRGNNIYTSGNLEIYRRETDMPGWNGHTCMPNKNSRERGSMVWKGKSYDVDLEYII